MAEKKNVPESQADQAVVDRAKDFWSRNNKLITIIAAVVILGGGGWLIYQNFFVNPNEKKAQEAIFRAEEYYRADSLQKALQGDGQNLGFLRIIGRYGNTKQGNLARYYAGDIYLRMGDNVNAVKHLKEFDTDSKPVQARAYKLLADAYADQGKNKEALEHYKKAGHAFEEDGQTASEYLFLAAYFAQTVLKNNKEAIELYKEIKEKFPQTEKGYSADKYLAQLGVYETTE